MAAGRGFGGCRATYRVFAACAAKASGLGSLGIAALAQGRREVLWRCELLDRLTRIHRSPWVGQLCSAIPSASGRRAAERCASFYSSSAWPPPPRCAPAPTHHTFRERHAQRHRADAGERHHTQVIRDKKEAEQVAKKLFKDHKKDRSPKKVKDARKAFKKEEAVKLTRGGGAPPIPKPPSGEPPSEEEARRRARRLMRRMSRKRKGKKHHKKSKAFKKGML